MMVVLMRIAAQVAAMKPVLLVCVAVLAQVMTSAYAVHAVSIALRRCMLI